LSKDTTLVKIWLHLPQVDFAILTPPSPHYYNALFSPTVGDFRRFSKFDKGFYLSLKKRRYADYTRLPCATVSP